MSHKTKPYASDLTEREWEMLQPLLLPARQRPSRPMQLDLRQVLKAIFLIVRTGCQWEYLPKHYPNVNSVYDPYRQWCTNGTWEQLHTTLRQQERQRLGRNANPRAGVIASQSAKTTEVGGACGYDAGKKIKGRQRHIVVDSLGNLLKVVVHAADVQDDHGAKVVLARVSELVTTLKHLWADGIYQNGGWVEWAQQTLHVGLEIVTREPGQKGFCVLPRRWVVERTFAWLGRFRRLSKDYEKCTPSREGIV